MMKRFRFRKPLDVSTRGLSEVRRQSALPLALGCIELESRVVPSGNAPVGLPIHTTIIEDNVGTVNLASFFTDDENDPLTFAIVSQTNTTGLITPTFNDNGTTNPTLTLTPSPNGYGYSYFRITVNDGTSTVNGTLEVIVREKDDLADDTASVGTSSAVSINVLGNDGVGDNIRQAEAGNMRVVQNDAGNASTSVTVTFPEGTPNLQVRTGSNRADYNVQIGSSGTGNVTDGLLFATPRQNLVNNNETGSLAGPQTVNTFIDSDNFTSNYWIPTSPSGIGGEYNVNSAVAYFPYAQGWLGGFASNSVLTPVPNGAANNVFRSVQPNAGFDIGSSTLNVVRDLAGGRTRITIPGINSLSDGLLLAIGAKNEDNYALCRPEAGGSWLLTVRDNGTNSTSQTSAEQDPVAFVYIPKNMPNVVSGRVLGDGTIEANTGSGVFTLIKTGTGVYELSIPGQTPTTGVLLLSPESGTTTNIDDFATYEASGNNFIINQWDITGDPLPPTREDVGATTRAFSFAFIPFLNTPTLRVSSLQSTTNVPNQSDLGATLTINANGTVNYNPLTSATIQGLAPLSSTTDTFTYTTTTLTGVTTTATVTVTVTAPSVWFVDDAWSSLNANDTIADANPIATGNQSAVFGMTAYASLNAAIAAASPGQKIIVNAGTYNEELVINKQVEITFQEGNTTLNSIADTVTDATILIQPGVTITFGNGTDTTISSVISGGGGIVKQGTGTITLSGLNTYSGSTTVSGGNLVAGVANAFSPNSSIALAATTELRLNGFDQAIGTLSGTGIITNNSATNVVLTVNNATDSTFGGNLVQPSTGTISLVKQGAGVLQLDGTNSIDGLLTVNLGTLRAGSTTAFGVNPAVSVNAGGTLALNGFNYTLTSLNGTVAGTVTNGAAASVTLTLGDANTATYAGGFTNGGTGTLRVVKTGTGTFNANGASTFTGGFTVSQGTLRTANNQGFGTGTVTLGDVNTAANDVAVLLSVNSLTIANNFVLSANGTGLATLGTAAGLTGALNTQFNGSLTLNRDVILQAGNADRTTFAGVITGTGNITTTSPGGGSRITFNRGASIPANNFVGNITIGAGSVLQLGVASLFANGNIPDATSISFTSASSELRLTTAATTPDIEGVNALISLVPGAGLITRPNGTGVLNFGIGSGNGSGDFSGVISNTVGTLNLIKYGSGTQTLSGANTYNGATTINGGTLLANNITDSAFGTGNVIVDAGGTLGGTGSFGGTLALNGRLAPGGLGTIGTLTGGAATFGTGSSLTVDLNNTTPVTGFDQAILADGSSLADTTLNILAGTGRIVGETFLILNNTGSATLGAFANGSVIQALDNPLVTFTVNTAAGSGNDVELTVNTVGTSPILDFVGGIATFNAAGGLVNNTIAISNNGTTITLADSLGAAITLTPAAAATWTTNPNGSVTGPLAGTTGLVLNLGDGSNVLGQIDAAGVNLTVTGSGSHTVSGPITTTGSFTANVSSSLTLQNTITAQTVNLTTLANITGTGKVIAGTVNLTAAAGIGSSGNKVRTQAGNIVAFAGGTGVYITEDDSANVTATTAIPGNIDVNALAGTLTVAGPSNTSNGSILFASAGALSVNAAVTTATGTITLSSTDTLTITAAITSTTGNIILIGQNAIVLGADLNPGNGNISITSNADGVGSENLTQTAGLITTTNTTTSAVTITANTVGSGTGSISLDNVSITGRLNVNSNGGNVLYAGATPLDDAQRGLSSGGSGPSRLLIAASYVFTATGAGSIGTDLRPIQSSVPATNSVTLNAGDGGAYWTDWNNSVTLSGATATNGGNIRVVAANVNSHNLNISGPVTTGSGSIYLAADDNFTLTAPIGGPGFSGTVYLAGNRDEGNGLNVRMNNGASIVTSNTTANAVLIQGFTTNGTASGGITLNTITVGNGGTITVTTNPIATSNGDIQPFNSSVVISAPNGTINLTASPYPVVGANGSATAIGTLAQPLTVNAANVNIVSKGVASGTANGDVFVTGTGATNFTPTVTGTTGYSGNIILTTTSGVLTLNGTTAATGVNLTSTSASGGIVVNGSVTTGPLTMNAGTNTVLVNGTITYSTLATTANGGAQVTSGGVITGTGTTANPVAIQTGGLISPNGTGIGTLETGHFVGGGTLRFDTSGISGSQYDLIAVTGTTNLNGSTPQVFIANGYAPQLGDSFTVMTSTGAITGSFPNATFLAANNSAITLTATVNVNSVVLTVSNVVSGPVLDIINGQLVYNGGGSSIDNSLTISYAAGNYTFSELNEVITLGPGAAGFFTGSNGNKTFTGNSASFTSGSVTLGTGNDAVTINSINHPFSIDGGGQTTDTAVIGGVLNTAGNFTIIGMNDITAAPATLINAGATGIVTLTAINAIGTTTDPVKTQAGSVNATSGVGGIFLNEVDGANVVASSGGGIIVTNASGMLNFTGTTTGTGNIAVTSTTGTLNIAGATSAAGNIVLSSGDSVTLGANLTASGTVAIAANTDGDITGSFDQKGATITTTDATATALTITVNTPTLGTGDAIIGKAVVGSATGGTVTVNSYAGNILWSNDASYAVFSAAQQGLSSGGSNTQTLKARDYVFTSTGTASIGTALRPIQTDNFVSIDEVTGGNTANFASGTGGIYLTDWGAADLTVNTAIAQGGDIRIVSANAGGSNLFINGTVSTTTGSISLYADDELTLNPTAVIGGTGFSGTVDLIANRDAGNNQSANMTAGSKIVTSNATANAVTIQALSSNGGANILNVDLAVGGVTLADVTVGSGGSVNVIAGAGTAAARQGSIIQRPGTVLNTGTGTVNLTSSVVAGATASTNNAGNIGVGGDSGTSTPWPIVVTASIVNAMTNGINTLGNTGNINIVGTGTTAFNVTTTGASASTIVLATQAGILNVASPLATPGGAVSLTGAAGVTLNANLGSTTTGVMNISGPLTGTGTITTGGDSLTVTQAAASTYGAVISGTQGLVKEGTGVLTLSGANTFTGATAVNTGTLLVDGSLAISSGITVATGATLGGTGTVPAVTVTGKITGGTDGGAGQVTVDNLAVSGMFAVDLLGVNVGDQVVSNTDVNITGSALVLNVPNALTGTTPFKIIDNKGPNAVTGSFSNVPNTGDTITSGGQTFTISYSGGDGNDVTLTRVSTTPSVTGFVVNNGDAQRSRITRIDVTFDGPVSAVNFNNVLNAITLTRTAVSSAPTGVIGDVVRTGPAAGSHITVMQGSSTSLILTFDNNGEISNSNTIGVESGSLTDGYWRLQIGSFDSDANLPIGVVHNLELRRLYGDATVAAGGTVNGADLDAFGNVFSTNSIAFDFNNDGTINGADLVAFGNHFSNTL